MNPRLIRAALVAMHPEGTSSSMIENGRVIVSPALYDDAARVVRAILTELREPTVAMLSKGSDALGKPKKTLPQYWRDMIDEALKD